MSLGTGREAMEVREAVEDDAARLAELTDAPASVMREVVHDRTTRIATDETGGDEPAGVVSFGARREAVHITQLAGTEAAVSRLLDEPIRFARREDMAVEVLLEETDTDLQGTVTDAGFEYVGSGPRFEGRPTIAFRLDP
jgi:uncharacterized protein with von Willebrand factor type A (vWA) domain